MSQLRFRIVRFQRQTSPSQWNRPCQDPQDWHMFRPRQWNGCTADVSAMSVREVPLILFFLNMELQSDCLNVTFNGCGDYSIQLSSESFGHVWTFIANIWYVDYLRCFWCLFCPWIPWVVIIVATCSALFSQENHWRGSCSFSLHDCRGQLFSNFDRWNFDQTLWNVMQSGIAEDKTSRQNHQNCRATSPSAKGILDKSQMLLGPLDLSLIQFKFPTTNLGWTWTIFHPFT